MSKTVKSEYLNGNLERSTYPEWESGLAVRWEYDARNRPTLMIDSDENWTMWKYDEAGREIHRETNSGWWRKTFYNEAGKEVLVIKSDGYIEKFEYDETGAECAYGDNAGTEYGEIYLDESLVTESDELLWAMFVQLKERDIDIAFLGREILQYHTINDALKALRCTQL